MVGKSLNVLLFFIKYCIANTLREAVSLILVSSILTQALNLNIIKSEPYDLANL